MIKEKLVFWVLLFIFLLGIGFGISTMANKKNVVEELIRDIESTQVKAKKTLKLTGKYEVEDLKQGSDLKIYETLIKKSPFFRVVSEEMPKKIVEVVKKIVEEEPKKPLFKYRGRVQMGEKQTVIIEEELTGKSYFVGKGDKVGDYEVFEIAQDKVILKKEGSEDIILEAKEEKQR